MSVQDLILSLKKDDFCGVIDFIFYYLVRSLSQVALTFAFAFCEAHKNI